MVLIVKELFLPSLGSRFESQHEGSGKMDVMPYILTKRNVTWIQYFYLYTISCIYSGDFCDSDKLILKYLSIGMTQC